MKMVRDEDGTVWELHRPRTGGVLLKGKHGAVRWVSAAEAAALVPAVGMEDLSWAGGRLKAGRG